MSECVHITPCGGEVLRPIPLLTLDFRGFDSSTILILKGGNSHVRGLSWGVSRKV